MSSFSFVAKILFLLVFLSSFTPYEKKSESNFVIDKSTDPDPVSYDLFPVNVIIDGVGSFDLDVLYTDSNLLYINIEDLFRALKIPCTTGLKGIDLDGFIGNEQQSYSIDFAKGLVKVGERTFSAPNKLLKESGSLYMESSYFAKAFGITLDFNYRSLTIKLKADFELPIVKQIRLEKIRSNISKVKGEIVADTLISRDYHLFKFGTLDWSASSFQNWKGGTNNAFGLSLGTELLYGEANISVNYFDRYKFDNRQLQYQWRWIDNDKTFIKQAQVGKISVSTISFINAPLVGASIRNSPTTVRKAQGSYVIDEITEANWTVELYINNVLVDFTTADASGSFTFKVPIVYGFTTVKLRYYGPTGEERTEEREMNVPYTVVAPNEFEYGLSAGVVQDGDGSLFGKWDFNYGVNRILTVGGGVEYLSSLANNGLIPFAKATVQPFSKLILNGEYAHGVRTKGLLNYYITKDILLELDYAKYAEGQKVTLFNASEEREAKLSMPFHYKKVNGYFRLDYSQLVYDTFNYNYSNLMFSASYKQFNANASTQINWVSEKDPFITNDLVLGYRFRNNYVIRSSARYNATDSALISFSTELEKRIAKGYFSASLQRNLQSNDFYLNVGCKYDFSFARATVSGSQSKLNSGTSISARGSLAFGGGNGYIHSNNNSSVGKGGILLYPFLDLNNNGILDKGEHMVKLTTARISGGRAIFNEKDSIVRIPNLNSFTSYLIEFNDNDLDNIAWRFKHKTYKVLVDPNQFKRIDVPILSMGEISGMAYMEKENELKGIGRILIKIYEKNSDKVVAETLSEYDGYIYKLGLKPGEYRACVDLEQLSNLNFIAEPSCRYFTIKASEEGDIVDGIDFILKKNKE
ncbi:hypothetical protein HJ01_02266 [Flavobacterium frigoris PS1]|uniref:Outer membrane usher protein FimD/PapC n=2 Tax=Flavobacterium frigoris TaxID=229204 RepID=H7FS47_FLAFP|nr:hypothetical protein HJ01_02266 [Flavobacterium frigoris PS1]